MIEDFTSSRPSMNIKMPVYKSMLLLHEGIMYFSETKKPNAWVRFWTKFFLGWTWSDYK